MTFVGWMVVIVISKCTAASGKIKLLPWADRGRGHGPFLHRTKIKQFLLLQWCWSSFLLPKIRDITATLIEMKMLFIGCGIKASCQNLLQKMPWIYNGLLTILDIDKSIMNPSNMCCGQCKVEVDHRPQMSSAAISKFALEALWTVRRREPVLLLLNNWALHHSGNNWFIESSRSVVSLVIIWLFVQTDRLSCHLTGLKRKS